MHRRLMMYALLISALSLVNSSRARGDDAVVASGVIDAPVAQVWDAFTTSEGLQSWLAPHAEIELKVGGLMRTNYSKDGTLGDEGTIFNEIQSFQPQRMLSIHVKKAPEKFPFKQAVQSMWTVLLFEEVSPRQTRLTVTGMGFGDDEQSQAMRKHFEAGNRYTLAKLQEHFNSKAEPSSTAEEDAEIMHRMMRGEDERESASQANVLDLLHNLIGGDWIVEQKRPDGAIFRAHTSAESGPDGNSIIMKGWLGDQAGMTPHASTQIYREPGVPGSGSAKPEIRFQSINERGDIARGGIRAIGDNKVAWDWNVASMQGPDQRYRVEMTFDDAEHYRFVLFHHESDGALKELVNIVYARVAELPKQFKTLTPAN